MTGTAASTTPPTAAAPAWSCAPSRGRGARPRGRLASGEGACRASSSPGRRGAVHPGTGRASSPPSRGWPSPAAATRASTSACRGRRATRMPVSVISLGDYVLNGGEVAVLAIVEAVARLLPGVIGNAESLVEESHEDGLLEYPVYTKPAPESGGTARVPPVLLSGDHGAIAAWRHQQRLARTAARRPDLRARLGHPRRRRPGRPPPSPPMPRRWPSSSGRAGCRRPSRTRRSTSRRSARTSTRSAAGSRVADLGGPQRRPARRVGAGPRLARRTPASGRSAA